jgi:hypothetical protein
VDPDEIFTNLKNTGDKKGGLAVPEYAGVHQDHIWGELLVVDGGEVGRGKVLQHTHVTLQVRGAPHLLHHNSINRDYNPQTPLCVKK